MTVDPKAKSESCRNCADKLVPTDKGWKALNGFPCIPGHTHEPWPDLLYVDAQASGMPEGVSVMRLVSTPPNLN